MTDHATPIQTVAVSLAELDAQRDALYRLAEASPEHATTLGAVSRLLSAVDHRLRNEGLAIIDVSPSAAGAINAEEIWPYGQIA